MKLNTILAQAIFWPALILAGSSAHAALVDGHTGNGTPLTDTSTGLSWFGFATQSEGAAQGYRLASGTEFNQLLLNAGLTIKTPGPTSLPWSPEDLETKSGLELILNPPRGQIPQELRDIVQAQLDELNALHAPQQAVIDPVAGITYGKAGTSHLVIPGLNFYRNFNGDGNPEMHANYLGWVSEGSQLLSFDVQYNFVPSQCPDPSSLVRYCGGTGSSWAAVGTAEWFDANHYPVWTNFNTMNGVEFPVAPGYLMVRAAVPEVSTFALMLAGLGGLAALRRRRA